MSIIDRLSEEFAIQNIFLNLLSKLADGYANDMAVGDIDTKSGGKVNGYSHLVKVIYWTSPSIIPNFLSTFSPFVLMHPLQLTIN